MKLLFERKKKSEKSLIVSSYSSNLEKYESLPENYLFLKKINFKERIANFLVKDFYTQETEKFQYTEQIKNFFFLFIEVKNIKNNKKQFDVSCKVKYGNKELISKNYNRFIATSPENTKEFFFNCFMDIENEV